MGESSAADECLLSDAEHEGAAAQLLRAVRLHGARAGVDLVVVTARARITLDPRAPSGCRGALDLSTATVRWSLRGSLSTIYRNLAHELGHYALLAAGHADHGEGDATRAGLAIWAPRAAVLAVVDQVGTAPAATAPMFPYVPGPLLWLRFAWVLDRPLILHLGRQRLTWAPEGMIVPPAGAWEREREVLARAQGGYRDLLGADAWAVEDGGRRGTLMLLPGRDDPEAWVAKERAG